MKFAHVGDTHLGATNFKLKEREEDFLRAFKQFVDKCLEEKVDFVVHSGDLFDKPRPPNYILRFCLKQLKRLHKNNIPFFVIPGSHDLGVGGSPISILDEVGYVINLGEEGFIKEEGEKKLKLKGYKLEKFKVFICGLPGIRARIKKIYKNLEVQPQDGYYNIFVFHHTLSNIPQIGPYADIDISMLPKGFDYYAAGHYHSRTQLQYGSSPVNYPGSTEYCDLTEVENDREKGFFIVEDGKARWVKLETRKFVIQQVNCNNLSPLQIPELCRKIIRENKGGILILRLLGRLASGNKSEINREIIERIASEKGYIFTKVDTTSLLDQSSPTIIEIKRKSLDEIEEEFLRKQKYSEGEIKLAKYLIKLLGRELKPSELRAVQAKVYEFLLKELGLR